MICAASKSLPRNLYHRSHGHRLGKRYVEVMGVDQLVLSWVRLRSKNRGTIVAPEVRIAEVVQIPNDSSGEVYGELRKGYREV